jgi:hypothetical protein
MRRLLRGASLLRAVMGVRKLADNELGQQQQNYNPAM